MQLMQLAYPRILLRVLEHQLSELDVLWERRELVLFDPELVLDDLAEIEARAAAHLRGVLLGQGHALDRARAALRGDETGAATAAAFTLLDLGHAALRDELLDVLRTAEAPIAHGIRIALRHRPLGESEGVLREIADSAEPLARACAADVLAFQRRAAVESVRDLLGHADPAVRVLACESLGRWRSRWEPDDLVQLLESAASPRLRRAALETSARAGLPLVEPCRELGLRASDPLREATAFLGVVGGADDVAELTAALRRPDVAESALAALGALGFPTAMPAILDALFDPHTAHAAAAAFLRITGAENVRGEKRLPPPADLPEDDLPFWDDELAVDPDLAARWWRQSSARFDKEQRWQAGVSVSADPLGASFARLPLQARRDTYLRACAAGAMELPDLELETSAISQLRAS